MFMVTKYFCFSEAQPDLVQWTDKCVTRSARSLMMSDYSLCVWAPRTVSATAVIAALSVILSLSCSVGVCSVLVPW